MDVIRVSGGGCCKPGASDAGVVMGCGWQVVGAIVNGVTYWIVGLPTLAVMVFKMKAGVVGFWWTICMICSTQVSHYFSFCLLVIWMGSPSLSLS